MAKKKMHTPQISESDPLVTWVPAELHEGKNWYIGYWVLHPEKNVLVRKQIRWNRIKNVTERRKRGKEICRKLNRKLENGWNPFIEQDAPKAFEKLSVVLDQFINHRKRQLKNGSISPDSLRSYNSYINNLRQWLADQQLENCLVVSFNKQLVRSFLDEIYIERDNSPRTHNNYLSFLKTMGDWMLSRDYIKANPTERIEKEHEGAKKRQVIPREVLTTIFAHLREKRPRYHLVCQLVYACMIRRTEMTKLRVRDIHLAHRVILPPADTTKNKKEQPVTIPDYLIPLLTDHLKEASNQDFLFSDDYFRPGPKQLSPKKISDNWNKVRKELALPKEYQWYSLKDTGITNLLEQGVPAIKVRDQARHYDLSITDAYTPKHRGAAVHEIAKVKLPGWD